MSRKRKAKKQLKHQVELGATLQRLFDRGAYPELLTVFRRRVAQPAESEHAGLYFGAVDHVLLQALAQGDLNEATATVEQLDGRTAARPLAQLARGALALRDGNPEAAGELLEDVATNPEVGTGTTPDLSSVLRPLLEICRLSKAGPRKRLAVEADLPEAGDLKLLENKLHKLSDSRSRSTTQPRKIGLVDHVAQAAWDLARTMQAVAKRDFRPTSQQITALRESTSVLKEYGPAAKGGFFFFSTAATLTSMLVVVAEDRKSLRSRKPGPRFRQLLTKLRDGRYSKLKRLLEGPFEQHLLSHLQYTLRVAWTDLVELGTGKDQDRLTILMVSFPALLPGIVRFEETGMKDPGASASAGRLARALCEREDWHGLAELLDSQVIGETDSRRRALLRAVGLSLVWRFEEEDEEDFLDRFFDDSPEEPSGVHDSFFSQLTIVIRELDELIPKTNQVGMARFLRDELVFALKHISLCSHFGRAALALLEQLPDDLFLLVIAAATCADEEETDDIRQRIAERGPARVVDGRSVSGLMREVIGDSDPDEWSEILERIRPLFSDHVWREVLEPTAPIAERYVLSCLDSPLAQLEGPTVHHEVLSGVVADLAPYWGGMPAFESARAVVDCLMCQSRKQGESRLDTFHEAYPGVKAALVLLASFVRTGMANDARSQTGLVVSRLAGWIVDRMDLNWGLWLPALPHLVHHTKETDRLLEIREVLDQVLEQEDLDLPSSFAIFAALEELGEKIGDRPGPRSRRRRRKVKAKARKKRAAAAGPKQPEREDEDVQLAFDFSLE